VNRAARLAFHLCRLLLGGLFLYAGAVKALDTAAFAGQVAAYRLLPYAWNYLVAATLPGVEILSGALLLVNRKVRPAALLLGALTLLFVAALASAQARGLEIDCGCFRPGEGHANVGAAMLRDFGILLLAAVTFRFGDRLR
jgi:uncharacterized membrane protein YphA (DoxX/SURF4 family)